MRTPPGFNAEASLYRSGRHYQQHFRGANVAGGETTIQPALEDDCSGGGATCHCSGTCTATSAGCSCGSAVELAEAGALRRFR